MGHIINDNIILYSPNFPPETLAIIILPWIWRERFSQSIRIFILYPPRL